MIYLTFLFLASVYGQTPIPPREDGFVYNPPSTGGSPVISLSIFGDLICPDTKAAWPTMKALSEHYGNSKLEIRFHLFPLPYHRQSFVMSQAANAFFLEEGGSTTVFSWIDNVFNIQDHLGTMATTNWTEIQVKEYAADLALTTLKIPKSKTLAYLGYTTQYNENTRVSWKYGCSRAVTGTPTFMVNNVAVAADPSWSVKDWEQVLDPLFGINRDADLLNGSVRACPSGTSSCTYLPGKVECCTPGENCIPNVGCRC